MKARPWTGAALFAASVLLHVAALMVLLGMLAPRRAKDGPSATIDVVWIRPQQIRPIEELVPVRAKPRQQARRSRPVANSTSRSASSVSAPPMSASQVSEPVPAEPVFDRQGALMAARKLANEPDPARAGSVGAALDARRVLSETQDEKMGRTIASGKRTDCLKANGGGSILTPLMWLLDKKGNGCKW
jgi:hypothetical protein